MKTKTQDPKIKELLGNIKDTPENIYFIDLLMNLDTQVVEHNGVTIVKTSESELYTQDGNLIFRTYKDSEEPTGFVNDPDTFLDLLLTIDGWTCCSVDAKYSRLLGKKVQNLLNRVIRYHSCKTYVLDRIPNYNFRNPQIVRLARTDDIDLINNTAKNDEEFASYTPYRLREFISQGLVVISVVNGAIVSIASAEAITPKYVETMSYTKEGFRGRGFATDERYLLIKSIISSGKTAVTSIADSNIGSLKVTRKFGYRSIGKDEYFIIGNPPYKTA